MKLRTTALVLFLAPTTLGCGMLIPHVPGHAGPSPGATAYARGKGVQDSIRASEAMDHALDTSADEEIAKQETDLVHAIAVTQGREPFAAGMQPYVPASQALAELRAAKFKLSIDPVANSAGNSSGFVMLKDSFSEHLNAGTATVAERRAAGKVIFKLAGLRMQVQKISQAAGWTNHQVVTVGLSTMLKISSMVSIRRQYEMAWTDEDYARVQRVLARQKHWEAMAAATTGMLAAYGAVVATSTADPKALDAIADATSKTFPLEIQVTENDAKTYVANLSGNVANMKSRYETMMRQNLGDEAYEAHEKANIDRLFAQAANASNTKSIAQTQSDAKAKYQARANGSPAGSNDASAGGGGVGSMVPGNVNAAVSTVQNGVHKAQAGLGVANAMANGDAAGAIQSAADAFPGDGPIQSSLQGVAALTKGDYKGALKSAMGLASIIPGGAAIQQGLGLAGKLLGLF